MKLRQLRLKNVGKYRSLSLDLEPGLTLFYGNNGSGKSTVLEALYFLISGRSCHGHRDDLLRWGTSKGEGMLEFEADNEIWTLSRSLGTSSQKLVKGTGDNVSEWRKAAEIAEIMEELLGGNPEQLWNAQFAPQGSLGEFIEATPKARAARFQEITGTEEAETMRTILQTEGINALPQFPDRSEEKKELEESLKGLKDFRLPSAEKMEKELDETMASRGEDRQMAEKFVSLSSSEEISSKLEELRKRIEALRTEEQEAPADLPTQAPPAEGEPEALYRDSEEAARLQKIMSDLPPEAPVPEQQLQNVGQTLQETRVERKRLEDELQRIREGRCPTCGRPYDNLPDQEQAETSLKNMKEKEEGLIREYGELTSLVQDGKATNAWRNRELSRIQPGLVELQKRLVNRNIPSAEEIQKRQKARQEWSATEQLRSRLTEIKTELGFLHERRLELESAESASDEQKSWAQSFLASWRNLAQQKQEAELEKRDILRQIDSADARLTTIAEEERKASEVRSVHERWSKARDKLHRDCMPRIAIEKLREQLNLLMAGHLEALEAPFTAWIDDELEIRFVSMDSEESRSASRLSAGQKVLLGIAFRLALVSRVNSRLPVIAFDEPTVHLDTRAVEVVQQLLRRIAGNRESGRYVLVADCRPEMEECADTVLKVEEIVKEKVEI